MSSQREHLLIDGYNLIKSSQLFDRPERPLEQARMNLQRALDAYQRHTQNTITLYYDGDSTIELPQQSRHEEIRIIFSHAPETADDLIMRAAQDKHGAKWLRVISSDREIRRYAERHKIRSTRSEDFLDELDAPIPAPLPQASEQSGSAKPLTTDELDEWERLFTARPAPAPKPRPQGANDGTETDPHLDKHTIDEWERLFKRGDSEQ